MILCDDQYIISNITLCDRLGLSYTIIIDMLNRGLRT